MYLAVLKRRWSVMLPAIVLVPGLVLLLSLGQPKTYAANAQVLISYTNVANTLNGLTDSSVALTPTEIVATQAALARNPAVAQRALSLSGVRSSPTSFLDRSSVSTVTNADLLEFSVRDARPAQAERLATNYAKAYIQYKGKLDRHAIDAALANVTQRLGQLPAAGQTGATFSSLSHEQQVLTAAQAVATNDAVVAQPAQNAGQVAPRPTRSAAIGLGVGIVLALGLAFLLEALDTRVSSEEIERRLGLPLLARIPTSPRPRPGTGLAAMLHDGLNEVQRRLRLALAGDQARPRRQGGKKSHATVGEIVDQLGRSLRALVSRNPAHPRGLGDQGSLSTLDDSNGRQAEAFRVLKSSLDFAGLEHDLKSILVTCGREYEGKSTTVANLAVTLVQSGRRVLLCDLDARSPAIADVFGLEGRPGVMDVVLGHARLDDAVVTEIPFVHSMEGFLGVLPFGTGRPPNPGWVGSQALADLVEELKERAVHADHLLIHAPALLAYEDTLSLSARVDAVLVALAAPLPRRELDELARTLATSPALPVGFITVGAFPQAEVGAAGAHLEPVARSRNGTNGHAPVPHTFTRG
jgi:Mrp family chromosome partitioning ATPase/capsular polysaccharide biosynthesis protein